MPTSQHAGLIPAVAPCVVSHNLALGGSQQVLNRFGPWIEQGGHTVAGVLPPPVTEFTMAKGRRSAHRIVVAWMGRPLESKGLLSIPHLLKLDGRLVVRAWTGAETGGN